MKHYTRVIANVVEQVRRSLPRTIVTVDGLSKCHTPAQVEENGELALYGWYVFQSVEPALADGDYIKPLEVKDVVWSGTAASATHRKLPIPRKQRRQAKLAEAKDRFTRVNWTQGPAWLTYKNDLRAIMAGLLDNSLAPIDVVWPTLPGPIDIA